MATGIFLVGTVGIYLFGPRLKFLGKMGFRTNVIRIVGTVGMVGFSTLFVVFFTAAAAKVYIVTPHHQIQRMWLWGEAGEFTRRTGEVVSLSPDTHDAIVVNETKSDLVIDEILYGEVEEVDEYYDENFPLFIPHGEIMGIGTRRIHFYFDHQPADYIDTDDYSKVIRRYWLTSEEAPASELGYFPDVWVQVASFFHTKGKPTQP